MARLFMQAYSLFQPCQTDAQISFLQNCLRSTAHPGGDLFFGNRRDAGRSIRSPKNHLPKWTEGHIIVYRRLRERGRENHAGIEDLCGPS